MPSPVLSSLPAVVWGVLVALPLIAALVFLVLWLLQRRRAGGRDDRRIVAEGARIDAELALGEQSGRLRIIRELNEVALHTMSQVVAQADGARYAAVGDPAVAARSSAAIAEAARAAVADLRRVLSVVRESEVQAGPHPELDSVRDLLALMREAGLVIEFTESGERYDLPAGSELAIFRILQQALTNALQHGGVGTEASILMQWTEEGLRLQVDDDGERATVRRNGLDPNDPAARRPYTVDDDLRALTDPVTGIGITEMRQRAELFGGVLTAQPVPGVGFSIAAVFPALRYHNGIHGVRLRR